jgi:drug/metabolite transporter (DMT)-like permease
MSFEAVGRQAGSRKMLVVIAAFAAVYVFWGSTYLAIKYAIETMPPFIMAGSRFLIAGGILFVISWFTKDFERPTLQHWRTSLIIGTLLLLGGNGGVVFAEKYLSSSLAALLVATEPFWIVILSWLWLKNGRPTGRVVLGLVAGFTGVALLVVGQSLGGSDTAFYYQMLATAAIIVATMCWAAGSIYGLKAPVPRSALLTAGMQMLSGGAVLMLASLPKGEWAGVEVSHVSMTTWLGLGYLIVFGSLVGFTAYSWLLKNAQPSMVATYAYVNPVVAVFLGWGIAGESITGQILIGAVFVIISVILVTMKPANSDESVQQDDRPSRRVSPHSTNPGYSTSS